MNSQRQKVKLLIELSANVEEADATIKEYYGFESIEEKTAFLKGMFDVQIISAHDAEGTSKEESAGMSYWAMLQTIINQKYN